MAESNSYLPYLMRIAKVTDEAPAVKTFRLEFTNPDDADRFDFKTGQFGLYSAFGEGESTFCIASSPTRKGYIECTFRAVGRVTHALASKEEGDIIGFRVRMETCFLSKHGAARICCSWPAASPCHHCAA